MKVALLGDIAPFGRYCLQKTPGVLSQFADVRELLRDHDLVIGNLETPFIGGESAVGAKSAHIHAHPDNVALLKYLGVTHVTLANNHIGDFGTAGYRRTKSILDDAGIDWFGTENRALRLDVAGEKVSLLGYCSLNTNPSQPEIARAEVVNILNVDRVIAALEKDCQEGYFPILAIHSGQEHVHMPSSEDVEFARGLASRFGYIYYGHHPHVVQGTEIIENSLIFYSLGNFVFDDVYTRRDGEKPLIRLSEANKTGAVASIELVDGQVRSWRLTPIYLGETRIAVAEKVPGFDMGPYNEALTSAGTEQYDEKRRKLINDYIETRYAMRDLKWYLKRLNINSVGMVLAARKNNRLHYESFTSQLDKLKGLAVKTNH